MGLIVANITENFGDALTILEEGNRRHPDYLPIKRHIALVHASAGQLARAAEIAAEDGRIRTSVGLPVALNPFLPANPARVRALRDEVAGTPEPDDALARARRAYVLGLLDLRLGQDADARAAAELIDSLSAAVDPRDTATVGLLARSVRATAALAAGDAEGALTALGPVDGDMRFHHGFDPLLNRMRERYLLGTLLLEAGRPEEARPWLEHGFEGGDAVLLYRAAVHLRLAEVHQRLGNADGARHHYTAFLRLLDRADPELQPLVQQGRTALLRLTAESE